MIGEHCDRHSFEIEDVAMPVRASKREPDCLRTTSARSISPGSANATRGAAVATRKNTLFITARPRD